MRDGAVAEFLCGKLFLLQLGVRSHAGLCVAACQVEHGHIQRVEACERDKLEFVAHLAQLLLKIRDGHVIQLLLPIERW